MLDDYRCSRSRNSDFCLRKKYQDVLYLSKCIFRYFPGVKTALGMELVVYLCDIKQGVLSEYMVHKSLKIYQRLR
jgi:hypothetical protein